MEIKLHIILQKPPAGVYFGLQKGSGSKYETEQTQLSASDDLHFNLAIIIKGDPSKDESPKFSGPFVQGPTGGNFIYIDIGTLAGQTDAWTRRLKIPLTGINWNMINEVKGDERLILETQVAGSAKDGSPNCATVKPFYGWTVVTGSR